MKTAKYVVIGTSIFLFLYSLMPSLGFSYDIIFLFFMIGQALVIYMVYTVLKDTYNSKKSFDKGDWYEDIDKKYAVDQNTIED